MMELVQQNPDAACAPPLRESTAAVGPFSSGPLRSTVLDLLWESVRLHPDATAILDDGISLSYAQLWNFADAFRTRLQCLGVQPGDMVGIAAGRSAAAVAAILGVVMAGGCYVPIAVEEFPAGYLAEVIGRNNVRYWVVDADSGDPVGEQWNGCSTLALKDVSCPKDGAIAEIPSVAISPESPLYVMFTSGSTGLPKGVVVPHRAVVRLVTSQNFIQFGPDHTFLLHSPLSFDASTLELWGSLLQGSRLAIAPKGKLALDDYSRLLRDDGVTTLWLTAAMFHLAAEHAPEMFAPLHQLLFGGDVIAPRHVQRIRELYPQLHMVNGYGPTENTTFTCCYIVPEDYRAESSLPIGSPLAHTTVHILDGQLRPVSDGQQGELVAGGAGVALGYLAQPEVTAERFIRDPYSTNPDARMYRTGDRVRRRQDGAIEFLGRMDRQVKIAGHRVEVAAVESAIADSPHVADAAVIVLVPASGEKQLAACVLPRGDEQGLETKLRESLTERFGRAAVPQHWLFLNHLPITANGKLDRTVLREMCEKKFLTGGQGRPARTGAVCEPRVLHLRDAAESLSAIRGIWAQLLGRESIGEDENFFDLGGTSLLLIEMHARLRAEYSSVPSLVEMFDFPTPRALAQRVDSVRAAHPTPSGAEERGQRQRAAMLARRIGPAASGTIRLERDSASARKDGAR